MNPLEEGTALPLDFQKLAKAGAACPGVIPVAVQNADTREVILIAYTNETALKKALAERTAIFWSTSRNELWEKGKTSGETFDLLDVRVNCEQNSLVYLVRPRRGASATRKTGRANPATAITAGSISTTGRLVNLDP
jgi:phosphoribosyl-AMP cyclohydrolase